MGQGQSSDRALTHEQLTHELAFKFAKRCFTPLELYSFQDVFKSLADHQDHIAYLKEDTVARFLEIPDILAVSPIVFQLTSNLAAFPFLHDGPAVLGFEQMVMVVVLMTERYQKVLRKGSRDRTKLLFGALAVYDRLEAERSAPQPAHPAGFAIDAPADDDDDDDDDDLALAALEALDALDAFKHGEAPIAHASIPADNLRKLIMLLLIVAPLDAQESLSRHTKSIEGDELENVRRTAEHIVGAFLDVETSPGVGLKRFRHVIDRSLPQLFAGLTPLFEHFLFSKNINLHQKKGEVVEPARPPELDQPLLVDAAEILSLSVLSQLSFFVPRPLFRQLRLLYAGSESGFSMGSFETRVFNWRAPTILLVSGNRIADPPASAPERAFVERLPHKRFAPSKSSRVVFGVYLAQPWKQTHKECVGDAETRLFQLEPVHEVFHASSLNHDYVSFSKSPSPQTGIAVGCPIPTGKGLHTLALGSVSLLLDASFEFGVFTHDYTSGGGAFHKSESRRHDWQDRFEIESLEVWGCGGDAEAAHQRAQWAWEEREAEARRKINLGTGDLDADRALLEMAGLVGANRSGGSMG